MAFHFSFGKPEVVNKSSNSVRSSILIGGIGMFLFGLAIAINPDLLAYLISTFFMSIGVAMFIVWLRTKH